MPPPSGRARRPVTCAGTAMAPSATAWRYNGTSRSRTERMMVDADFGCVAPEERTKRSSRPWPSWTGVDRDAGGGRCGLFMGALGDHGHAFRCSRRLAPRRARDEVVLEAWKAILFLARRRRWAPGPAWDADSSRRHRVYRTLPNHAKRAHSSPTEAVVRAIRVDQARRGRANGRMIVVTTHPLRSLPLAMAGEIL